MILDSIIGFIPKDPTRSTPRAYFHASKRSLTLNLFLFFAQKHTQTKTKKHKARVLWSPHSRPIVKSSERV